MTGTVLDIREMRFEGGDCLVVDALIEGAVLVRGQTHEDPAEWCDAVCRGSLHFCDEDLIPATDDDFRVLLSERIDNWEPLDLSDLYGDD